MLNPSGPADDAVDRCMSMLFAFKKKDRALPPFDPWSLHVPCLENLPEPYSSFESEGCRRVSGICGISVVVLKKKLRKMRELASLGFIKPRKLHKDWIPKQIFLLTDEEFDDFRDMDNLIHASAWYTKLGAAPGGGTKVYRCSLVRPSRAADPLNSKRKSHIKNPGSSGTEYDCPFHVRVLRFPDNPFVVV